MEPEVSVHVPFRIYLPAGSSSFVISVPKRHFKREFFFSSLDLIPQFYSDQAFVLDLDTVEELDEMFYHEIGLKIAYDIIPSLYPEFKPKVNLLTMPEFIVLINNFYEANIGIGLHRLGFFFDWIDVKYIQKRNDNETDETWDEWIQNRGKTFYDIPYNPELHWNKLPPSARDVRGCNNYLFPTNLNQKVIDRIRFRMNIGPNMRSVWSTDSHLLQMGFSKEQIGERTGHNQLNFLNEEKGKFRKIFAFGNANYEAIPGNNISLYLRPYFRDYQSDTANVEISKKDTFSNEKCRLAIEKTLILLSKKSNLSLGINYDSLGKKFSFVFPANESLRNLKLRLKPDLSYRLGFPNIAEIDRNNGKGERHDDIVDPKHVIEKARALAFDTGITIVSDANTSANTTSGINEQFMAALFPTETGNMTMSCLVAQKDPPMMRLTSIYSGNEGFIPATFKLSRILDNSELVNLVWKNGAFVSGVLDGVHKHHKRC